MLNHTVYISIINYRYLSVARACESIWTQVYIQNKLSRYVLVFRYTAVYTILSFRNDQYIIFQWRQTHYSDKFLLETLQKSFLDASNIIDFNRYQCYYPSIRSKRHSCSVPGLFAVFSGLCA